MRNVTVVFAAGVIAAALSVTLRAQNAPSPLDAAARALGSTGLHSIQYAGTGANFAFGQAYSAGAPWPRFNLKTYVVAIDYTSPAMRVEFERTIPAQTPPAGVQPNPYIWKGGGGAPPFVLPQRRDLIAVQMAQFVSGNAAWNVFAGETAAALGAVNGRLADIWMTPHGVIKAAQAAGGKAMVNKQGRSTLITFPVGNATLRATLNAQNLVERVTMPEDNPVLGDTAVETTYSDYRDYNGVKFPSRILRKEGDFPTLDLTVTEVHPNANMSIDVPASVAQAAAQPHGPPPAPKPEAVKLADGIYRMEGPGVFYHSVAVEFKDYIVVVEGGMGDELALPIIDAVKKAIPNKPIKYVINTHVNFDHAGGLRAFVAEGATVVTHTSNKAYYQKVWGRPHTIHPDRLAQSPRTPVIEGVGETRTLTDGDQRLELYHFKYIWHNTGLIAAYLPKAKLLVVPDMFEGVPRDPAPPNPDFQTLYNEIQRMKLDVVRISPLHTSLTNMDALRKALGNPAGD